MINLLASNAKEDLLYARRNTIIMRWCILALVIIAGIGIIGISGIFYMRESQEKLQNQIELTKAQLKEQDLEGTQKQVESISSNVKLTIDVLSREILFSKLIRQIGSAMPADTSLTNLQITKTQGGIDLSAIAKDYNAGTQVQLNLQDPTNKIFDKADLVNISCGSDSTIDARYPCTVTVRAQFGKNNSFYLIPPKGTKK
jgi:uncharacterized protein YgfB (UPF0149 family)